MITIYVMRGMKICVWYQSTPDQELKLEIKYYETSADVKTTGRNQAPLKLQDSELKT